MSGKQNSTVLNWTLLELLCPYTNVGGYSVVDRNHRDYSTRVCGLSSPLCLRSTNSDDMQIVARMPAGAIDAK